MAKVVISVTTHEKQNYKHTPAQCSNVRHLSVMSQTYAYA